MKNIFKSSKRKKFIFCLILLILLYCIFFYNKKLWIFSHSYFLNLKNTFQSKESYIESNEMKPERLENDTQSEEERRSSGYDLRTALYTLKVYDFWKGKRSKTPWEPGSKYEHIAILKENSDLIEILGINLKGEVFTNQINMSTRQFNEKLVLKIDNLKRPYDILITQNKDIYISYSIQNESKIKLRIDKINFQNDIKSHTIETVFETEFIQFPEHINPSLSLGGKMIEYDNENLLVAIGDINLYNDFAMSDAIKDINSNLGSTFLLDLNNLKIKKYTSGHRNPEGLTFNNKKNKIYLTEHGPQGGDEVNTLERGNNYGWPFVSYGTNYTNEENHNIRKYSGIHKINNFTQPLYSFTPSIGIKSIEQFPKHSEEFPKWSNDFLVCSSYGLYRMVIDETESRLIVSERLGAFRSFGLDNEKDLLHGCRDIALTSKGVIISNNLSLIFNSKLIK